MARALLTPDELRRLDVDDCIIYEKGLKPIKARKYYYYKYNTAKMIAPFAVDHNTREIPDRGVYRKFNPYNPYVEKEEQNDLKIEELDDLFEDNNKTEENTSNTTNETKTEQSNIETKTEQKIDNKKEELNDIQKELEAKFDELFGSIDSNN